MNVLKNIIIILLTMGIVIFWLQGDEDEFDNDSVTIEYLCSMLNDYDVVPPEVAEECKNRKTEEVDKQSTI